MKYPNQQFVLNANTTEQFVTLTTPIPCTDVESAIQAVLLLSQRDANFKARLAIRKALSPTSWGAWTTLAAQDTSSHVTDAGPANEKLWRFDPNGATTGDIDNNAAVFQLGIGYAATTGQASATVIAHSIAWR